MREHDVESGMCVMAGRYVYDYPRPMVAVDVAVLAAIDGCRHILLIQRKHEPFAGKWGLPGGFIGMEETLEISASRELEEETGLRDVHPTQLHTFGGLGRDPRGRLITVAFVAEVDAQEHHLRAGDDAGNVGWFPLDALPDITDVHREIVAFIAAR